MFAISKTPLRISFFGGGTDYPDYFVDSAKGGCVIGMAIDKHIYTSALGLRSFIDYKFRAAYSRLEMVQAVDEIQHPVIREVLKYYQIEQPLDFSVLSDLPSRTGLGSSSAFTVGLVNLIAHLRKESPTKLDLAETAIFFERDVLKERVGVQDQYHAAFGGINRFDFGAKRTRITPVRMTGRAQQHLVRSMILIYTGNGRYASEILEEQMSNLNAGKISAELDHMHDLVDAAQAILEGPVDRLTEEFGQLMHEGWLLKRKLSSRITNPHIDDLYDRARSAGAIGGKLCGAGGGGFLLIVADPDRIEEVEAAVHPFQSTRIDVDAAGSQIIYHTPDHMA